MAFHLNGFLDKETYTKSSSRAYPVFANQRDELYGLFDLYRKLKRECGHYDPADRSPFFVLLFYVIFLLSQSGPSRL